MVDRELMERLISGPAPTIWAHSFNAMTNIRMVMSLVRVFLSFFLSSLVFLNPTSLVRMGMTKLATTTVAKIHMTRVTRAVNH